MPLRAAPATRRWLRPVRPGCTAPASSSAPTSRSGSASVGERPAVHERLPAVGRSSPSTIRIVVDLPGAVGPEEAGDLAGSTSKLRSSTASDVAVALGQPADLDHRPAPAVGVGTVASAQRSRSPGWHSSTSQMRLEGGEPHGLGAAVLEHGDVGGREPDPLGELAHAHLAPGQLTSMSTTIGIRSPRPARCAAWWAWRSSARMTTISSPSTAPHGHEQEQQGRQRPGRR